MNCSTVNYYEMNNFCIDKKRFQVEQKEFTKKCGSEEKFKELENKRPKKALSAYMIFVRETRVKV